MEEGFQATQNAVKVKEEINKACKAYNGLDTKLVVLHLFVFFSIAIIGQYLFVIL